MTAATITKVTDRGSWKVGALTMHSHELKFEAKVYEEGSQFGINGGRVSKLWIADPSGFVFYEYDRGLDRCRMEQVDVDAIVAAIESL